VLGPLLAASSPWRTAPRKQNPWRTSCLLSDYGQPRCAAENLAHGPAQGGIAERYSPAGTGGIGAAHERMEFGQVLTTKPAGSRACAGPQIGKPRSPQHRPASAPLVQLCPSVVAMAPPRKAATSPNRFGDRNCSAVRVLHPGRSPMAIPESPAWRPPGLGVTTTSHFWRRRPSPSPAVSFPGDRAGQFRA